MNCGRILPGLAGVALAALVAAAPARAAEARASPTGAGKTIAAKSAAVEPAGAITPDPAVRRGVLPNGLRYFLMRGATPKGGLSIRLGFDVGSFEENDNERGAAHFVEHLAFNETRNFKEGEVDRKFSAAGVAFGRDLNAFTSLNATTYFLDLQDPSKEVSDLAFRWLRDVADGISTSDKVVEAERGVIMAEREARLSPGDEARRLMLEFQAPGLRSVARDPMPPMEHLRSIRPLQLKTFYERWYRPENAVLAVVGDAPLDEMERRVKTAFESWKPSPVRTRRAAVVPPDPKRGVDALVAVNPKLPAVISACRLREPEPEGEDTVAGRRRRAASELWRRILDARLSDAVTGPSKPPFLAAQTVVNDDLEDAQATCLVVVPMNDEWRPALKAAQAELRRFAVHGPRADEVKTSIAERRAYALGALSQAETRRSPDLATALMSAGLEGEVFPSPREALRVFDAAVEGLGSREVLEAFNRDWSGAGPILGLVVPAPVEGGLLKAAWAEGETGEALKQTAEQAKVTWAYDRFGRPGAVAKREVNAEHDFVRLTFKNGLVANFKQTDFERDAVDVRLRFGAGRREVPNERFMAANLGAMQFKLGGVGKHSYEDLTRLFQSTSWDVELSVGDESFGLRGETTAGGLANQLKLLTAYVSDPGFNSSIDVRMAAAIEIIYRVYRTDPSTVLGMAISEAVFDKEYARMPPREELIKLKSADFERLFKPALTQAPLEVTIVGDVSEKTVTRLLSETLGALPPRPEVDRVRPDTWFQRFPERSMAPVRTTHEGSPEKAVAGLIWPLYVAVPERRREEYALSLVAGIMTDMLVHRVREELGKTYSPGATTYMPDHSDQGYLMATAESYPDDIDLVVKEMRAAGDKLARGEITEEALEQARKPLLTGLVRAAQTNARWAAALDGSARNDQGLKDITQARDVFADLTLAEVKAAAARWLTAAPIVVTATPEPPSTTTAAAPVRPLPRAPS